MRFPVNRRDKLLYFYTKGGFDFKAHISVLSSFSSSFSERVKVVFAHQFCPYNVRFTVFVTLTNICYFIDFIYVVLSICCRELLESLEQCGCDPVKIAQVFVDHSQGFSIYTDYCTNYPRYEMQWGLAVSYL